MAFDSKKTLLWYVKRCFRQGIQKTKCKILCIKKVINNGFFYLQIQ